MGGKNKVSACGVCGCACACMGRGGGGEGSVMMSRLNIGSACACMCVHMLMRVCLCIFVCVCGHWLANWMCACGKVACCFSMLLFDTLAKILLLFTEKRKRIWKNTHTWVRAPVVENSHNGSAASASSLRYKCVCVIDVIVWDAKIHVCKYKFIEKIKENKTHTWVRVSIVENSHNDSAVSASSLLCVCPQVWSWFPQVPIFVIFF